MRPVTVGAVVGWRVFAVTAGGMLTSIPRYGHEVPVTYPGVDCVAGSPRTLLQPKQ